MGEPRIWTRAELAADAERATAIFRVERLDEPLDLYKKSFAQFQTIFGAIVEKLPELNKPYPGPEVLAEIIGDQDQKTAFRYLTAPPISEDDLKTLAKTTLSAKAMRENPDRAECVRKIVRQVIDPHRFPWIVENRQPTVHEREQAIVASAALVAAKKVETERRKDSTEQENSVKRILRDSEFTEVRGRDIRLLDAAPAPGEFCRESKLGDTKGDIIVRLYDRRVMPIECKVSNSAVNSYKRLIHEAGGKASKWIDWFGRRQTVPAAVLSGVFSTANLEAAQNGDLALFWSHRVSDLVDFIESLRI
jgi:hypothetical protein